MTERKHVSPEALDASLLPKQRKAIPHAFVLDTISTLSPYTRPMFGCLAIYVKDKIVLILRDKPTNTADNGVWLATIQEHHQSLRREFPTMRLMCCAPYWHGSQVPDHRRGKPFAITEPT